jgi:hypothetical protein
MNARLATQPGFFRDETLSSPVAVSDGRGQTRAAGQVRGIQSSAPGLDFLVFD